MKTKIVLIFMFFSMFYACKPAQIIENTVIKHVFDSIYIEKTDTFRQFSKGDTVFLSEIHWKTAVKYHLKTDTVRKTEFVEVKKPVYITKTVEKKLPFWKTSEFAYWMSALAVVLYIVLKWLLKKYTFVGLLTKIKNGLNTKN